TYAAAGSYLVRFLVTSQNGTTQVVASRTAVILTAEQQGTRLQGGTGDGDDSIVFTPGARAGSFQVQGNGHSAGTLMLLGPVLINGNGGADTVTINGTAGADRFVVNGMGLTFNGFTFQGAGIENWSVNGGAGKDTLVGSNKSNTWNITGVNRGMLDS